MLILRLIIFDVVFYITNNNEQYLMQTGKYNAVRTEPLLVKKQGIKITTKSQIEFRLAGTKAEQNYKY